MKIASTYWFPGGRHCTRLLGWDYILYFCKKRNYYLYFICGGNEVEGKLTCSSTSMAEMRWRLKQTPDPKSSITI